MEINYGLLIKKSLLDMKNNLIVFLPLLYSLVFFIGFMIIIGVEVVLGFLLKLDFTNWPANTIIFLAVFGIIDFILLIYFVALNSSLYPKLVKEIVTKNSAKPGDINYGIKKFSWILFKLAILKLLIVFLPVIIFGAITLLTYLIGGKTAAVIVGVILGIIGLLYFIAAGLLVAFALFFATPILALEKTRSVIELLKISFKYSKENIKHVIITWLIILGISLGMRIISQTFSATLSIMPLMVLVLIPLILVLAIVQIAFMAWSQLFVFNAYYKRDIKKL